MSGILSNSSLYPVHFLLDAATYGPCPHIVIFGDKLSGKKTLLERLIAYPVPNTSSLSILFCLRNEDSLCQEHASVGVEGPEREIYCEEKQIESAHVATAIYNEVFDIIRPKHAEGVEMTVVVTLRGSSRPNLDLRVLPGFTKALDSPDQILVRRYLSKQFALSREMGNVFFLVLLHVNTRLNTAAVIDFTASQKPPPTPGLVVFTKFSQCMFQTNTNMQKAFLNLAEKPSLIQFGSPRYVCTTIESPSSPLWAASPALLHQQEEELFEAAYPTSFGGSLWKQRRASCAVLVAHLSTFCNEYRQRVQIPLLVLRLLYAHDTGEVERRDLEGELRRAVEYILAPSSPSDAPSTSSGVPSHRFKPPPLDHLLSSCVDKLKLSNLLVANSSDSIQQHLSSAWSICLPSCEIVADCSSADGGGELEVLPEGKCAFRLRVKRRCPNGGGYVYLPTCSSSKQVEFGDWVDAAELPWRCSVLYDDGTIIDCQGEGARGGDATGGTFSFLPVDSTGEKGMSQGGAVTISVSLYGVQMHRRCYIRVHPTLAPGSPGANGMSIVLAESDERNGNMDSSEVLLGAEGDIALDTEGETPEIFTKDSSPGIATSEDEFGDGLPGAATCDDEEGDEFPATATSEDEEGDGLPGAATSEDEEGDGLSGTATSEEEEGDGLPGTATSEDEVEDGLPGAATSEDEEGDGLSGTATSEDEEGDEFPATATSEDEEGDGLPGAATREEEEGDEIPATATSEDEVEDGLSGTATSEDEEGDGLSGTATSEEEEGDGLPATAASEVEEGDEVAGTATSEDEVGDGLPGAATCDDEEKDGLPGVAISEDEEGGGLPGAATSEEEEGDEVAGTATSEADEVGGILPGTALCDYEEGDGLPATAASEVEEGYGLPGTATSEDEVGDGLPGAATSDDEKEDGLPGAATSDDEEGDGLPETATSEDEVGDGLPGAAASDDEEGDEFPATATSEDEVEDGLSGTATSDDEEKDGLPVAATCDDEEGVEFPATATSDDEEGDGLPGTATSEEEEGDEVAGTATSEDEEGVEFPATATSEDEEGDGLSGTATSEDEEGVEFPATSEDEEGDGLSGTATSEDEEGDKFSATATSEDEEGDGLSGTATSEDEEGDECPGTATEYVEDDRLPGIVSSGYLSDGSSSSDVSGQSYTTEVKVASLTQLPSLLLYAPSFASSHRAAVEESFQDLLEIDWMSNRQVPTIVLVGERGCGKRSLLTELVSFPVPKCGGDVPVEFRIRRRSFGSSQTSSHAQVATLIVEGGKETPLGAVRSIESGKCAAVVYKEVLRDVESLSSGRMDCTIAVTLVGSDYPNVNVLMFPHMGTELAAEKMLQHAKAHGEHSLYVLVINASSPMQSSSFMKHFYCSFYMVSIPFDVVEVCYTDR